MACASRSALASPRDGLASWFEAVVAGATGYDTGSLRGRVEDERGFCIRKDAFSLLRDA
jgi:hypothetical protein